MGLCAILCKSLFLLEFEGLQNQSTALCTICFKIAHNVGVGDLYMNIQEIIVTRLDLQINYVLTI